jgi:hypothetical protein
MTTTEESNKALVRTFYEEIDKCNPTPDLGGLARDVIRANGAHNFLALTALVAAFHKEMVRLRRHSLPLVHRDLDSVEAFVIGALTDEGHTSLLAPAVLD